MAAIAATKERALENLAAAGIRWPSACAGAENNLGEKVREEKSRGQGCHCSAPEES